MRQKLLRKKHFDNGNVRSACGQVKVSIENSYALTTELELVTCDKCRTVKSKIGEKEMKTTERELTESNTETSGEILDAIYSLADGDEATAHRIWSDPSEEELLAIWETVTKNGLLPADDFCFGASGHKWAEGI